MLRDTGRFLADSTADGGLMQLLGCGCLMVAGIALVAALAAIWAVFSWIL